MNVPLQQLLSLLGAKEVELMLLREQIEALSLEIAKLKEPKDGDSK